MNSADFGAVQAHYGSYCDSSELDLVGFVPGVGSAADVVVDEAMSLVYVTSAEFGLSIVDVIDPAHPLTIGAANPPFGGTNLAASGAVAAVVGGLAGLRVVDMTDPTMPVPVGSVTNGGSFRDVTMDNAQYAYALVQVPGNPGYWELEAVDLRIQQAPVIAGRITLAGGGGVQVAGTRVYVAAGSAGLQIVNVTNPNSPTMLSTLDTPGAAGGVAVANGYAYVADNTALKVINVANPSSPSIVGSLATAAGKVTVSGNRAYVLGGGELKVVDITNPASPRLLNTSYSYNAQDLDAAGGLAFLANPATATGGLYVLDVSLGAPELLASMRPSFGNTGIAVSGSRGTIAGGVSGLTVVDVSDPTLPLAVGSVANGGSFRDVTMDNTQYSYALVQVPGNPGYWELEVVNLQTPQAPVVAGRITLAGGGGVQVAGTRVYVAAGSAGLQIVNVTNPNAPAILSTLNTPGAAGGVAVANGYAYVADNTTLKVINVLNPSSPSIVGSLTTVAAKVAVRNNRAYVLGGGELKIIDVANPANPVLLSTSYSYNAQDLDASGGLAFLAVPGDQSSGGLYVVDVSDPFAPTLLERIVVPGSAQSVCVDGTRVYTSDSASIINVFEITP